MLAGRAGAVGADAVGTCVGAARTRARIVVACDADAVGADAHRAHIAARAACTDAALVVVAVVLVMRMPVVDVVDMVLMNGGGVAAGGTVRMGMGLGRAVIGDGHFRSYTLRDDLVAIHKHISMFLCKKHHCLYPCIKCQTSFRGSFFRGQRAHTKSLRRITRL